MLLMQFEDSDEPCPNSPVPPEINDVALDIDGAQPNPGETLKSMYLQIKQLNYGDPDFHVARDEFGN